jgi:hypothetical protein
LARKGTADTVLSDVERTCIATETCADPVYFCNFFLPHLFCPSYLADGSLISSMPWVHRGILAILTGKTQFLLRYGELDKIVDNFVYEDEQGEERHIFSVLVNKERWGKEKLRESTFPPNALVEIEMHLGKYTLIEMPRGFSKTTIAGIAVPLYNILFGEVPFTLYISEAGPHARMQLDNVKRELSGNDKIIAVFGPMKPKLSDDEKWSQDLFETLTSMKMAARGRGSQVRGLNYQGQRPSKIICDDLEDRESVDSEIQRMKVRTWAYGDLMPALAELDEDATIVALGTLLHKEALLQVWSNDPEWTVVRMSAHDRDGEPLWPRLMDREKYLAKKKSFAMAGMLHIFYMEYDNVYRAPELQVFKQDHLHVYIPESKVVCSAVYLDPAISDEPDASYSFLVVVSRLENGMIRIRDCWWKRDAHPREQVDMYFLHSKLYLPQFHGVETNAYQKALKWLLREEMAKANYFFEVISITNTQKKDKRIRGIVAPRWAADYITFDRKMPELETELLDYPNGRLDGPDALAGAIALLEDSSVHAADENDPLDDEYLPLEKVLGGDWRWAN